MTMDVDRYPTLGRKVRISGPEEALERVRALYPLAVQHGSTGAERPWTIGAVRERMIVAHHWSPGTARAGGSWWLRVAQTDDDMIGFDL